MCGGDRINDSLTTECPLVRMDDDREEDVASGKADFHDGKWFFAEDSGLVETASPVEAAPATPEPRCSRHHNVMVWRHSDGDRCSICGEFFDGRPVPPPEPSEVRTFSVYRKLAERTDDPSMPLDYFLGSLCGESGELWEKMKKVIYHGHEFTDDLSKKVRKEFGDILWYLDRAALRLGFRLEDLAYENNVKLLARYPDGFDKQRSIDRAKEDDETEAVEIFDPGGSRA